MANGAASMTNVNKRRAAGVNWPAKTHPGRLTPTARHSLSHHILMY